ncbi:MAG: methionyl-tRNA formyltransferase, partial [Desulfobacterales bacterium]
MQENNKLKHQIALLGTYHPAVPTFERLAAMNWICLVVMPKDAGHKNDDLLKAAKKYNIEWSYDIKDIEKYNPTFLLAANYPKIVPKKYLEQYICINTHWSLLPRWRGVHPTAWAVINGDEHVGLTVHMMEEDFDTGNILAQKAVTVPKDLDINELHEQLAQKQASCVLNVFENYLKTGVLEKQEQNETHATYVPQRYPEDGLIDWNWPKSRIAGLVKALPLPKYPGAFTYSDSQKVIISKA